MKRTDPCTEQWIRGEPSNVWLTTERGFELLTDLRELRVVLLAVESGLLRAIRDEILATAEVADFPKAPEAPRSRRMRNPASGTRRPNG